MHIHLCTLGCAERNITCSLAPCARTTNFICTWNNLLLRRLLCFRSVPDSIFRVAPRVQEALYIVQQSVAFVITSARARASDTKSTWTRLIAALTNLGLINAEKITADFCVTNHVSFEKALVWLIASVVICFLVFLSSSSSSSFFILDKERPLSLSGEDEIVTHRRRDANLGTRAIFRRQSHRYGGRLSAAETRTNLNGSK